MSEEERKEIEEKEKENQEKMEEEAEQNENQMETEEEEEEEEEENDNKELTNEEIKNLIQQSGKAERKYFLELSEWSRPGSSFDDWGKIEIIEGKIKMIEINHEYNYPSTDKTDYLILPLTKVVILKHKSYNDYNGDDYQEVLYVFSPLEGWRSLRL